MMHSNGCDDVSQQGFTLVELVMAMLMVALLGTVIGSVYLYSSRWFDRWQKDLQLENSAHQLMNLLLDDLRYSNRLVPESDSLWKIEYGDGQTVKYLLNGNRLLRDTSAVLGDDVEVEIFNVSASSTNSEDLYVDQLSGLVRINIVLRMQNSSIQLYSGLGIRQTEGWPRMVVNKDPLSNLD